MYWKYTVSEFTKKLNSSIIDRNSTICDGIYAKN